MSQLRVSSIATTAGVEVASTVNGMLGMPNQPMFDATANYGTNYSGQLNPIIFGSVSVNVGSNYNSSNGRFTATVAGNYYFFAQGHRNASNNYTTIRIRKNGSAISNAWCNGASGESDALSCATITYLNISDYVDVEMATGQNNYMAESYWKFLGYRVG